MKKPSTRRHKCNATNKRRPTRKRNALASAPRGEWGTHGRIVVREIGRAVRIDYDKGRAHRFHAFTKAPRLYVSDDGKHLIIAPVTVKRNEIHG